MEIRFFVEVDNYWSTVGLQQHATNHSNTFIIIFEPTAALHCAVFSNQRTYPQILWYL